MDRKFHSAGSFRRSRQFFLAFLTFSFLAFCRANQPDPQMQELQKDVKQLSEENRKLQKEIQSLKENLNKKEPEIKPAPQTAPAEIRMTVDQMKQDIQPLLRDIITKIKAVEETPRKAKQYGMRIEYDIKNAVYGLIRNPNPSTLYHAKVIIKYEKFLESEQESRSYGSGSATFLFAYQSNQWVLQRRD